MPDLKNELISHRKVESVVGKSTVKCDHISLAGGRKREKKKAEDKANKAADRAPKKANKSNPIESSIPTNDNEPGSKRRRVN
eukprot:scaffold37_cov172-Ochromonas_danica.AAC.1